MAYMNSSPAYQPDDGKPKRIAKTAQLPDALTMPNGSPAGVDDVRRMYQSQASPQAAAPPQPQRIATTAQIPPGGVQSLMGMVASRARAQGAATQPMQARPTGAVQQTPPIAGFGVGGQAQANRNARLEAAGVDRGAAQRRLYAVRDARDAHYDAAVERRKNAEARRKVGDVAGAAALMREANDLQRQGEAMNREVVSGYNTLNGTVGDLDPATQARNHDALTAQIPNAQQYITDQFENDANLRRQKLLANDRKIMAKQKDGYTSQNDVNFDNFKLSMDAKAAAATGAEAMRRREMLARDGAQDLPPFSAVPTPNLNLSGMLRDQETELADRATASTIAGNQRLQVENQSAADAAMPGLAVKEAELKNLVLAGQLSLAEAQTEYAKLQAAGMKASNVNTASENQMANEGKARTLEVEKKENYIAGLAEKIGPALLHIYSNAGDAQFVGDTSAQSQKVQEALDELEQQTPVVKAEVAKRVLAQLEDPKVNAKTIAPRSGFGKVAQGVLDVATPLGALRKGYSILSAPNIGDAGKQIRDNPVGTILGNSFADTNSATFNDVYAKLRKFKLLSDMK